MCRVEESDIGCHLSLCPNFAHGVCGDLATDLVPVCGKKCVNFQLVSVCPSWLPQLHCYVRTYHSSTRTPLTEPAASTNFTPV